MFFELRDLISQIHLSDIIATLKDFLLLSHDRNDLVM